MRRSKKKDRTMTQIICDTCGHGLMQGPGMRMGIIKIEFSRIGRSGDRELHFCDDKCASRYFARIADEKTTHSE